MICAVPSPPLRRVEIQPAFSKQRRKAIAELRSRARLEMELEKIRQKHAAKESFLRGLAKANL
jgi:hypothetical protein